MCFPFEGKCSGRDSFTGVGVLWDHDWSFLSDLGGGVETRDPCCQTPLTSVWLDAVLYYILNVALSSFFFYTCFDFIYFGLYFCLLVTGGRSA